MKNPNEHIQQFINSCIEDGAERGLQVVAYHKGKLVIDCCAGYLDASNSRKVTSDTLFPVFSCTKGVAATILHQLVERGKISYDTPIAKVWPEFAAEGKSNILLRHALNHSCGLQFMPSGIGYAEINDWKTMCSLIAKSRPVSPPGAQIVYHAMTYGWIIGEVACRLTGKPFAQIMNEQICAPLGIKDMYIGIPEGIDDRIAILDEIFETGQPPSNVDDGKPRDVPAILMPLHSMMNRADARRACIPASNGIMSARALARHYASLLPGGVDGVELLPPARVREATQLQPLTQPSDTPPPRIALGYFLGPEVPAGQIPSFGHGGYGGSVGHADPQNQLAYSITKNLYSKRGVQGAIEQEIRKALELA